MAVNGNIHVPISRTTFGERETTRLIAKVTAFNVGTQCPESAEEKVRPTFERVLTVRKRAGLPDTLQGKLQHLSKEIQDFRTKIWTIESRREDTSSWHKLHHNEREKLLAELEEAQFGLANAQETFWDLNVPGDPAQRTKERNAEASRWIRFKAERNEARQRAAWIRLEREARVNLATREQDLLDNEARLARTFKRGPSTKVDSSRSVSSRLGPVNQTNSKSVPTRGTASPAPLTTPKKPKRVGSEKRRRVERAKAERDPIGTPKVLTTTGTCRHARDLIARAQAKIDADAQVESLPPTLESRAGTPEDWEKDPQWDTIVTEDGLCEE